MFLRRNRANRDEIPTKSGILLHKRNIHVKWLSSHHCLIAPLIHVEVAFYFMDRKFILVNKLMNCSIDRPKQPSNDKIMELEVASVHHYSVKIKIHKSDVWNLAEVLIFLPTQVDDDSHCCCCSDKTTPAAAATQSNKRNWAVVIAVALEQSGETAVNCRQSNQAVYFKTTLFLHRNRAKSRWNPYKTSILLHRKHPNQSSLLISLLFNCSW